MLPRPYQVMKNSTKIRLKLYLKRHDIDFKPCHARRHIKSGIWERNHGIMSAIISRLVVELSNYTPGAIGLKSVSLSNTFCGNNLMSSFKFARVYVPYILGTLSSPGVSNYYLRRKNQLQPLHYRSYHIHKITRTQQASSSKRGTRCGLTFWRTKCTLQGLGHVRPSLNRKHMWHVSVLIKQTTPGA